MSHEPNPYGYGREGIHDAMIGQMATRQAKLRWSVFADLQGWRQPALVGHYRPDLILQKGSLVWIIEAETKDSISDLHTRLQWLTFAREAKVKGWWFGILVPRSAMLKAQQQATAWGIRPIERWWYDPRY